MEFLTNLWALTVLPFLMSYATTILAALIIGLMLAFIALCLMFVKPFIKTINSFAEKHLSEKVSKRVNDALFKVENVLVDLLTIQHNTIKKLADEAYQNDGKIDMKEVAAIAKQVASIAIARLTPEVSTLQKYLAGDMLVDYIQDKVAAIITSSVEKFLNEKLLNGKK
jgi:hypothetical protein